MVLESKRVRESLRRELDDLLLRFDELWVDESWTLRGKGSRHDGGELVVDGERKGRDWLESDTRAKLDP